MPEKRGTELEWPFCSTPGLQACKGDGIYQCTFWRVWQLKQECPSGHCVPVQGKAWCNGNKRSDDPSIAVKRIEDFNAVWPICVKVGQQICKDAAIYECSEKHLFKFKASCPPEHCLTSGKQAWCNTKRSVDTFALPEPKALSERAVPDCSTPGKQMCSDAGVYECSPDYVWKLISECLLGHCHMTNGKGWCDIKRADEPPAAECTPLDRACDSERRFLFNCTEDGRWNVLDQCYRGGACEVKYISDETPEGTLICAGFPLFEYPPEENRSCERDDQCEFDRLYCIGVSVPPSALIPCCV